MKTGLALDRNGNPIQGALGTVGSDKITVGAASARSTSDFDSGVAILELFSDTDCYISLSDDTVTATTTDFFLPADTTRYYTRGDHTRIAVIQDSAGGTLHINGLG